jgi:DNA-binding NarL/FixJ family response regulator
MPFNRKITLLLADDHVVMRQGLRALLNKDEDFAVVGEAGTGREATEIARAIRPDIILMDIAMPELNGVEAARQIIAADPAAKVLVLSAYSDDAYVERMIQVGVVGFLEKHTSTEILGKAIREIAKGRKFLSPTISRRLRYEEGTPRNRNGTIQANRNSLTPRESEVLQLVAEGMTNKRIGVELRISTKTVEKHRQRLMNKLNLHDTASLTRYAISSGVVENRVQLTLT